MSVDLTPVTDKNLLERISTLAIEYATTHLTGTRGPCEITAPIMEIAPGWETHLLSEEDAARYASVAGFISNLYSVLLFFPLAQHYSEQFLREMDKTEEVFVMLPTLDMRVIEDLPLQTDRLRNPEMVNLGIPEEQEALYYFLQRFCPAGVYEKFYIVPNGTFGPTTLQPHHKNDLLELRDRGLIHAKHLTNSPWETWLVSLPEDALEVPQGVIVHDDTCAE